MAVSYRQARGLYPGHLVTGFHLLRSDDVPLFRHDDGGSREKLDRVSWQRRGVRRLEHGNSVDHYLYKSSRSEYREREPGIFLNGDVSRGMEYICKRAALVFLETRLPRFPGFSGVFLDDRRVIILSILRHPEPDAGFREHIFAEGRRYPHVCFEDAVGKIGVRYFPRAFLKNKSFISQFTVRARHPAFVGFPVVLVLSFPRVPARDVSAVHRAGFGPNRQKDRPGNEPDAAPGYRARVIAPYDKFAIYEEPEMSALGHYGEKGPRVIFDLDILRGTDRPGEYPADVFVYLRFPLPLAGEGRVFLDDCFVIVFTVPGHPEPDARLYMPVFVFPLAGYRFAYPYVGLKDAVGEARCLKPAVYTGQVKAVERQCLSVGGDIPLVLRDPGNFRPLAGRIAPVIRLCRYGRDKDISHRNLSTNAIRKNGKLARI